MHKSSAGLRKVSSAGNNSNVVTKCTTSVGVPNTRSSKRRSGNAGGEQETTQVEDPRGQNEQLLGEKGLTNRRLLGGPATDQSGCLSSSKTLLRGNSSSAASQEVSEEPQSIPVVSSRSKRLRVATTAPQYNKITYTDRKTRSASSSVSLQSNQSSHEKHSHSSPSLDDSPLQSKPKSGESFLHKEEDEVKYHTISSSSVEEETPSNCDLLKDEPVESDDPSDPPVNRGSHENSSIEEEVVEKSRAVSGGQLLESRGPSPVSTIRDSEKVVNSRNESETNNKKGSSETASERKGQHALSSSGRGKVIIDTPRLTNPAPMLLMNNLPYMGELTFDTRPRRGRKPKKADICHLISKNYGIHFPNSYTNEPNTGAAMLPMPPLAFVEPSSSHHSKKGGSRRGGGSTSSRGGKKYSSGNIIKSGPSSSSTTVGSWEISPPDLVPIALSGRNLHGSPLLRQVSHKVVDSLKSPYSKGFKGKSVAASSVGTETCTKGVCSGVVSAKSESQEEPLNLCVRDTSPVMESQIRLTLSDFNAAYAGAINMKMPLISPANFFSDFQLTPGGRREGCESNLHKTSPDTKRSRVGGSSGVVGSSRNIDAKAKAVNDLSLVNNVNLQLSLATGGGMGQSKSKGKGNQGIKFAPPITIDDAGFKNSHNPHKKVKRRLSQSTQQKGEYGEQSQGNMLLKTSSVGGGESSHAGGCLFGQPDSGPTSGAQVSICKFKFTGGAKPSLQEKKMLSVDSGGNFRFYTDKVGTSSLKSMKSFPSGSSTQSSLFQAASGDGEQQDCQYAFSSLPKSAKSMSVCMPVRPSSLKIPSTAPTKTSFPSSSRGTESPSTPLSPAARDLHNLRIDGSSSSQVRSPSADSTSITFPQSVGGACEDGYSSSQSDNSSTGAYSVSQSLRASSEQYCAGEGSSRKLRSKRKRRTRKSLMREKLEKTFKEKGFLIQTQQLESAEGATYCKFRQLRKFTRYLFRSWKDYLPDNVKEINNSGANEEAGSASSINLATSSGGSGERGGLEDAGMEMELDLTTTNTHHQDHNDSRETSDGEDNEDSIDDEGTHHHFRGDPLPSVFTPQVTLTTEDSHNPPGDNNTDTDDDTDSSSINVDVEHIDGTSDNSSPSHNNPTTVVINSSNEHNDNEMSPDEELDDVTDKS